MELSEKYITRVLERKWDRMSYDEYLASKCLMVLEKIRKRKFDVHSPGYIEIKSSIKRITTDVSLKKFYRWARWYFMKECDNVYRIEFVREDNHFKTCIHFLHPMDDSKMESLRMTFNPEIFQKLK